MSEAIVERELDIPSCLDRRLTEEQRAAAWAD
jgi:hypothetical protein